MIIKLILDRLFRNKLLIILPMIIAPSIAMLMLLFVEPEYVSTAKLWVKDREEESTLLRVQRSSIQEMTYAEVQREIITSNPVLEDVVRSMNLTTPKPSQKIFSRLTGLRSQKKSFKNEQEAIIMAVEQIRKNTWVDVVNSEIIVVGCKMNTPELAQELNKNLLESYRKQYLKILVYEISEYKKFLLNRLEILQGDIDQKQRDLFKFEQQNPTIVSVATEGGESLRGASTVSLTRKISEVSPVPEMQRDIVRLEMERQKVLTRFEPNSTEVKRLEEEIKGRKELLKRYKDELKDLAKLSIKQERLAWELKEARRHYAEINTAYHQILLAEGTKVKQTSSITILENPSFLPKPIKPRKKVTLFSAIFLGFILGLGLLYIASYLDSSYYLPEEIEENIGITILAVIPEEEYLNGQENVDKKNVLGIE
ncbi:MAG: Wzz/FepE/Etk N-terminal domain-containing protein [Lentisphaeria bacterium]|nr:Wzz/FepE/Etk N-terminal domain-containing protein [Lentisphaeria bacterium]